MKRYIDADALISVLNAKADMAMGTPKEVFFSVAKMVDYLPPADVAQRAEVAREIFVEIETALNLYKCYGESGIYYEHYLAADIAELKKKYTEEKSDE